MVQEYMPHSGAPAYHEKIHQLYNPYVGVVKIWKECPKKYIPIVIAHELREYDRRHDFIQGRTWEEAHSETRDDKFELEIAKALLTEEGEFEEFLKWSKKYRTQN